MNNNSPKLFKNIQYTRGFVNVGKEYSYASQFSQKKIIILINRSEFKSMRTNTKSYKLCSLELTRQALSK